MKIPGPPKYEALFGRTGRTPAGPALPTEAEYLFFLRNTEGRVANRRIRPSQACVVAQPQLPPCTYAIIKVIYTHSTAEAY